MIAATFNFNIDEIEYSTNSDGTSVTIKDCDHSVKGHLSIPSTVIYENKTYNVTRIEDFAFSGCSGLTKINIPNSVTDIGNEAFYGCSGLTEINIPNSVTNIGNSAFYGCSGLTIITIPECVYSIKNTFRDSDEITKITIADDVINIKDDLFRGCGNTLKTIIIPNSVKNIGDRAFYGCSGLTEINIPNSVTNIGNSAFYDCSGLTEINIPNSVTSIGNHLFAGCSKLTEITIPGSITSIGTQSLSDTGIKSVIIGDGMQEFDMSVFSEISSTISFTFGKDITNIKSSNILNQIQNIICKNPIPPTLDNTFSSDNNILLEVPVNATQTYAKSEYWKDINYIYTIKNGEKYYPIVIKAEGDEFLTCIPTEQKEGEIATIRVNQPIENEKTVFFATEDISDKVNGEGYQIRVSRNHSNNTVYTYSLSKNNSFDVTLINGGELLDKITIEKIPYVYKLKINGPVNGTDILTIRKMTNLQILDLQDASIIDGGNSYYPNYLTSKNKIGSYFFTENNKIKNIKLPKNIEIIDSYAFSGCNNLEYIRIPSSTTTINNGAFNGCDNLLTLKIEFATTPLNSLNINNIRTLYLDRQISSLLGHVTFPSLRVVYIGKNMTNITREFYGCRQLQEVHISDLYTWCELTRCVDNPLSYAHNLYLNNKLITDLVIPEGITNINSHAFIGCDKIKSITIPNSTINIGSGAFEDCSTLTEITIPGNVISIGDNAFSGCSGLTDITIENGVKHINYCAFSDCSGLTKIAIPGSVTDLSYAFNNCQNLSVATIENGVININGAFNGCSSLTDITIPNSVTSIECTFYGCSSLTEINIPNSVTSIGNAAFFGCSGLTEINIPNSVTCIGEKAFYGCSGLIEIIIPNSVTGIENSTFENCNGLSIVTIKNGVTSIGEKAFSGCSNLIKITIPNSVNRIGKWAFTDCI